MIVYIAIRVWAINGPYSVQFDASPFANIRSARAFMRKQGYRTYKGGWTRGDPEIPEGMGRIDKKEV